MADKNESRNDRLTLRKTNEEVLRKKLQLEAQAKCIVETQQFGECAKKNGMLVVFSCRKENAASMSTFKVFAGFVPTC